MLRKVILGISLLLLFAAGAAATGDPSLDIRIVPIAATQKGEILFRTIIESNPNGGCGLGVEKGWLVISSTGLWKSTTENRATFGCPWTDEERRLYEAWANTSLDWQQPHPAVKELIEKYGFSKEMALDPNLGKGKYVWTPEGIRSEDGTIRKGIRQKSLLGLVSARNEGKPITCKFSHMGVILFGNVELNGDFGGQPPNGELLRGAVFHLPETIWKNVRLEEGSDWNKRISGICVAGD